MLLSVTEYGTTFAHGQPVTFTYVRNTEKAPYFGSRFQQDIEPAAAGEVKIKQGVAKDRIISAHDPEMRHGHKTSKGKFNGHKAQIMTDEASEIITNVSVTPGNEADGSALPEILQQSTVKPQILLGDTAYGTLDARDAMESQNVVPVAPLP